MRAGFRTALPARAQILCRTDGQQARCRDHQRRNVMISAAGMLSVFIREPDFVGQTKDDWQPRRSMRAIDKQAKSAIRSTTGCRQPQGSDQAPRLGDRACRTSRNADARKRKSTGKSVPCARLPARKTRRLHAEAAGGTEKTRRGDSAGGFCKQAA